MDLTERTVRKNYVYKGRIVNLRCDDAALPDGKPCKREMIEHPGGASVLCVVDGKIALVRQFRYAYGEAIYEIPAGKLDKDEDPMLAAGRELGEETGLVAGRLELMFVLYPTPGYTDEVIHIYLATEGRFVGEHLDEGEFLNCSYISPGELEGMIDRGEIKDAKTVAAYYSYIIKRNKGLN